MPHPSITARARLARGRIRRPAAPGRHAINSGTKVRLKPDALAGGRLHLIAHARNQDIGVVAAPSKQSPSMSQLYTIVHFEQCGRDHRLLATEVEPT
jgi:hypothetical protein